MIDLLSLHRTFIKEHLREGDVCCDFTMGNGFDTVFLSKTVGEKGRVYAFDIQERALEVTRERLEESGCPANYTLIHDSHHRVKEYVHEKIKAGMFNLGWLPGNDRSVYTLRETTLKAVAEAIALMDRNAVITVAVYPGHEEGDAEGKALEEYFAGLSRFEVCVTKIKIVNSPAAPYFFLIENK